MKPLFLGGGTLGGGRLTSHDDRWFEVAFFWGSLPKKEVWAVYLFRADYHLTFRNSKKISAQACLKHSLLWHNFQVRKRRWLERSHRFQQGDSSSDRESVTLDFLTQSCSGKVACVSRVGLEDLNQSKKIYQKFAASFKRKGTQFLGSLLVRTFINLLFLQTHSMVSGTPLLLSIYI